MIGHSTVLAFGFGNLAMLGWLAAAAAPLLIHLWSRRRYREISWAAMDFLLAAMKKNARRLQLQQWLLLALRTLIIVLVVTAVAEPYADTLRAGRGGAPAHKVLVFDASYSMAYRDDDESLLSRAKQLAAELVGDSGPGDVFTLILMGDPAQMLLDRPVDREIVIKEVESLTPAYEGADLHSAITLVEEALRRDDDRRHAAGQHEVYFFTDLQRATWLPEDHASLRERFKSLTEKASLVVVDVAPPARNNLAVTSIPMSEPYVTVGSDISFEANVREFGNASRSGVPVELLIDDVPVAEQMIDVPASAAATVRFTQRFRSPGNHALAIRAAGDALEIDNSRWHVVPVRDEVRVLCVAGKPGAARYIADALDPDPTDRLPIRPVVVSESDLAELELSSFACVFLVNVAQLTSNEANRLSRYAEGGGGVVFFLGDQILPDQYNTLVAPASRAGEEQTMPRGSRHLLPARLGEVVTEPEFGLDPLDYRHPIAAPFRGRERAGLLTTPVTRYIRLELPAEPQGAQVALATKSGDPFVVTAPVGRGRVVLVATDASLSSVDPQTGEPWTAWPTWPSFLPLVREMLDYAVGGHDDEQSLLVGEALSGTFEAASARDLVRITRPDGSTDSVHARSSGGGIEWQYDRTNISGIYTVELTGAGQSRATPQQFAVNVDTAESDLTKATPDDLPRELNIHNTWRQADRGTPAVIAARAPLHATMLWSAFGLLLIESLAAWRFGRGTV